MRWPSCVTFFVDVMTGMPSIVAGLFIYTVWVLTLGFQRSRLRRRPSRSSILMIPVVVRSHRGDAQARARTSCASRRSRSGVPTLAHDPQGRPADRARRASSPASCWASPGSSGETAPLLLLTGFTQSINTNPFRGPQAALPTIIYDQAQRPSQIAHRPGLGRRARPDRPRHDPQPGRPRSIARMTRVR